MASYLGLVEDCADIFDCAESLAHTLVVGKFGLQKGDLDLDLLYCLAGDGRLLSLAQDVASKLLGTDDVVL